MIFCPRFKDEKHPVIRNFSWKILKCSTPHPINGEWSSFYIVALSNPWGRVVALTRSKLLRHHVDQQVTGSSCTSFLFTSISEHIRNRSTSESQSDAYTKMTCSHLNLRFYGCGQDCDIIFKHSAPRNSLLRLGYLPALWSASHGFRTHK